MKPRRPVNLTSPAESGVFLFPSAYPCNGTEQAPPFAFTARAAVPLPLPRAALCRPVRGFPFPSPFAGPMPPPCRPGRAATAAAGDPVPRRRRPPAAKVRLTKQR
jgi:hypothetical protein